VHFRHASVKNNEAAVCEMSSLADGAGASDHSCSTGDLDVANRDGDCRITTTRQSCSR